MNNHGQGAMEYLMTYGWAILVVMIVGVVIWQLGVFSPGTGGTTLKDWNKLQPLVASTSWVAAPAAANTFTASFNNVVGTQIRINSISANELISNTICTSGTSVGQVNNVPYGTCAASGVCAPTIAGQEVLVNTGNLIKLQIICPVAAAKNRGDVYQVAVAINYTTWVGLAVINHVENGTIRGTAE